MTTLKRTPTYWFRYYWTRLWQNGERASLADLAAGRVRRFADPAEAIRYLQSDEEQKS